MGYFLLMYACSEKELGHNLNKPISGLPKKWDELLAIGGNPVDEEEFMFEQGVYLSVFFKLRDWRIRWRVSHKKRETLTLSWRKAFFK